MIMLYSPRKAEAAWHEYFINSFLPHVDISIIEKEFKYNQTNPWLGDVKRLSTVPRYKDVDKYYITDINMVDISAIGDKEVYGFTHGGAYEPHDIMYGDEKCIAMEKEMFSLYKTIYVATRHNYKLIKKAYPDLDNIKIVVFPYMDYNQTIQIHSKRGFNCFAGALNDGKGYDIIKKMDIMSIDVLRDEHENKSKQDYLNMLKHYRCITIPSRKETFGIAAIEAIFNGVIPLMPYSLSFIELFGETTLYEGWLNEEFSNIKEKRFWAQGLSREHYFDVLMDLLDSFREYINRNDARFTACHMQL